MNLLGQVLRRNLLVGAALMMVRCGVCAVSGPALTVLLRPAAADSRGMVPSVDVTVRMDGPSVVAGGSLLRMPLVASNVESVAQTLDGLMATDAKGPLTLTFHDDAEGGPVTYRHWVAGRTTDGVVEVRYRAPITEVPSRRGTGPPLELRSDTGGFSGEGEMFLMLPEADLPWKLAVRWDLSRMGAGAVGVSTLGKGDVTSTPTTGRDGLEKSFFMGGRVEVYPETVPAAGFFAAWYGQPPFDPRPLMMSEQKLFDYYVHFFQQPRAVPYGVFLRLNLVNAGGGVGLGQRSFVATFGPKVDVNDLKITLAHEMLHTFVGGLEGPQRQDDSWYAEGLAVYYARLLALRAGQVTPEQFLADLNSTAGRYYTDALIHTPNSEIAANFWADTRIRVLPYDRGSMYFAVVDGEVRRASGGAVKLDDLLMAMLARRKQGLAADQAAWVATVKEHLGEKGVAEFEAMLAGAIELPEADGFGPCFTRATKPMKRFQLGFEPRVLTERKRIVRGLIAGSAAETAGIRNGDEITKPVPQDILQGQQEGVLTLELLRDGKPLTISYVPRGETVDAYQWARVAGVPDNACAY